MDLSKIRIKVEADTKEAEKGLQNLKKTSESFSKAGKALTVGLTAPIAAFGVASVRAADQLRQTQKKTSVIFGDMTKDVQAWALENERTFGLGAGTIEGYTGKIADLTQGMGLGKKESLEMAKGAMELGVQLANWNGVGADVAMEDLTRAISGSHEAVEKYGIKLNDTVLTEQTRAMGLGDTFNKLTEAEKAQVRYEAIIKSSGNAIQFWNEGNRSTSFYLNEIKEQVGNVMEVLGGVFLPVLDKVIKKVADWTANFAALVANNPALVNAIIAVGSALMALGPALLVVSKIMALTVAVPALVPVLTGLAATIGVLGVAFIGLNENVQNTLTQLPVMFFNSLNNALLTVSAKLPEFLQKGTEMIYKILEGLVIGVPVLINFVGEMVIGILTTFFNFMPQFLQTGFNFVLNVLDGVVQAFPNLINAFVNSTLNILFKLQDKMPEFLQKGFDFVKNILDGAIKKMPSLLQGMIDGIIKILSNIRAKMPEFLSRGIEMVGKMISGIAQNMPNIISKMGELVAKLISTLIKNLPRFLAEGAKIVGELIKGIWNKRSELFNIGKNLITGLINTVKSAIKSFVNIGKSIVNSIKEGVSNAWGSFTGWISNKISNIPIIGNLFRSVEQEAENVGSGAPEGEDSVAPFARNNIANTFSLPLMPSNSNNFKLFDFKKNIKDVDTTKSKNNTIEIKLNIENFNNNRDIDLEGIMDEIAFNIKRKLAF